MVRKFAARVDAIQKDVVDALRAIGASVQHLHTVGDGCTDILVGYRGVNYLIEIKDGNKPPSERRLTPDQRCWHARWQGEAVIAISADEAVNYITRGH